MHPDCSIHDLTSLVEQLQQPIRNLFDRFFLVEHGLFNGGELPHRITRVYNRLLEEATSFDAQRRRRGPAAAEVQRLQQRCHDDPDCYFCNDEGKWKVLSRPGSGRVGQCVFFPPPAGFCRHHRLIFPDEHNPLCFSKDIVSNLFACGEQWALETVQSREQHGESALPLFYFVSWNVLCGSVVHAHCQVTLTSRFAEGGVERLARLQRDYLTRYQEDYFDDFISLHEALGLTVRRGQAVAMPSLTPVKEREVWLLRKIETPAHLPADLLALLCQVLESLTAFAEASCPAFNIGVAFPPLWPVEGWDAFPIVVRVVDRGWPLLGVSDWASMEMYGSRIVATDPFAVAAVLRTERDDRESESHFSKLVGTANGSGNRRSI